MSKEMIIATSPQETKVAILEDDQLVEVHIERSREQALVGSIYKGRVTKVLPGMQSAFVNIGLERDAFLYVSDFFEESGELDSLTAGVDEKIDKLEFSGHAVAGKTPSPAIIEIPTITEKAEAPGPSTPRAAVTPIAESAVTTHPPAVPESTPEPTKSQAGSKETASRGRDFDRSGPGGRGRFGRRRGRHRSWERRREETPAPGGNAPTAAAPSQPVPGIAAAPPPQVHSASVLTPLPGESLSKFKSPSEASLITETPSERAHSSEVQPETPSATTENAPQQTPDVERAAPPQISEQEPVSGTSTSPEAPTEAPSAAEPPSGVEPQMEPQGKAAETTADQIESPTPIEEAVVETPSAPSAVEKSVEAASELKEEQETKPEVSVPTVAETPAEQTKEAPAILQEADTEPVALSEPAAIEVPEGAAPTSPEEGAPTIPVELSASDESPSTLPSEVKEPPEISGGIQPAEETEVSSPEITAPPEETVSPEAAPIEVASLETAVEPSTESTPIVLVTPSTPPAAAIESSETPVVETVDEQVLDELQEEAEALVAEEEAEQVAAAPVGATAPRVAEIEPPREVYGPPTPYAFMTGEEKAAYNAARARTRSSAKIVDGSRRLTAPQPREYGYPRGRRGRRGRHRYGERPSRESREGQGAAREEKKVSHRPLITDLLREGQEILVQIAKEPLGKKGARITSHIALPGRYLVYMPTVDHIGVSRKIGTDEERQRLKRILNANRGSMPGGFIVRTAGEGRAEEELKQDIRFLAQTWTDIRSHAEKRSAPALMHRDLGVLERILRDQLSAEFTAIRIDNETEYAKVLDFVNTFQPALVGRVRLHLKDTPIFEEHGIDHEIEKALKPKVWLKSGGYIVINQTEAMVAIDVNTGKFVGKTTRLEDTIVKTNIDAAKEVARQVRLRDMGGIIVIDFIDMEERKNRQKVIQALEESMRRDRAPSKILAFNDFGLVALTRKRVKQSLEKSLLQSCPYCQGHGMIKSLQTVCYEIQQEAKKMAGELEGREIRVRVHPEVAKALKTTEQTVVHEIEAHTRKDVIIKSDPATHQDQFEIF
ncbi:MAG: Rne/Rng family ribonuclease [Acidobacteriia bacterium]|nr:Rne/Rng family ribonuclease [Terriglobia bacterium]